MLEAVEVSKKYWDRSSGRQYGPRHPYTQAFLAALPENGFQPLPGLPPLPQDHLPGCRFAPRCPSCQKRCLQEVPPVYDSGTAKVRCFLYA